MFDASAKRFAPSLSLLIYTSRSRDGGFMREGLDRLVFAPHAVDIVCMCIVFVEHYSAPIRSLAVSHDGGHINSCAVGREIDSCLLRYSVPF